MTSSNNTARTERQLVVFDLVPEAYGVDIGTVREIIRVQEITHVPNAPPFVEGVINLRGKVIPVVDLRRRFGMPPVEQTNESRIVVIDIAGEDIGVMVDAVSEVLRIAEETVETASSIITTADSYYIQGIAKLGQRLIILLDLGKTLSQRDIMAITRAPVAAAA
jgi:purine-binding chemotaxis protein CheW